MAVMLWVEDSDSDELLMEFAAADTPLAGHYEVARSVPEALDAGIRGVRAGMPHQLVVVDLRLPGGSGWDVVAGLRDHAAAPRGYVVLTSSNDPVDIAQSEALGCAHVQKPYTLEDWRTLVDDLVDRLGDALPSDRA
ncbi:hypothetical protein DVS28_a1834 [Euzebya pacifica]|uniref:Response regulatory domain-containing protein n=1 Tax=Euzebya pacifica TaxID=1608957 RepID=A0A346XWC8_9ACTN|nr:response regulator [Euzebya pacifica]AXV06525.1 hypothetical protein DVS28_a1834 [Euzebya pacifica]